MDGCEDPDKNCLPRSRLPGEDTFARAAENGLSFAAITDHAEYAHYARSDTGEGVDVWKRTRELAAKAEGRGVLPIIGFEWTGTYPGGGHRTVLLEDVDACEAYRIPARLRGDADRQRANGVERYTASPIPVAVTPAQLLSALGVAARHPGCRPTRAVSYFHHPASSRPRAVDWSAPTNQVGDALVEIFSEHGSAECRDLSAEGCAWNVNRAEHAASGAIQEALRQGLRLGFVGGTDNHAGSPGNRVAPSQHFGTAVPRRQHNTGGLTAVWVPTGTPLDRAALFDALLARHTAASSWPLADVRIATVDSHGKTWLPGDTVPVGAKLSLHVTVTDPAVEWVRVEVIDRSGSVVLDRPEVPLTEPLDVPPGEVRYVRLRFGVKGVEHRLWASPFFGG
jgi:hypothetical protein